MASDRDTNSSERPSGPAFADWKIHTGPEIAMRRFPWELAQEALAPVRQRIDPGNENFGKGLWPDLARACVAFTRARHDAFAPLTSGSPARAPTVPQLLSQIRGGVDRALKAADELMRQALEPRDRGEEADVLRLNVLERLSHALCLGHVPPELREQIAPECQPSELYNPFRPALKNSGFNPLVSLREEAIAFRREAAVLGKSVAGKRAGRHGDPHMRSFILELANIYRDVAGKEPAAHGGNVATKDAAPSLFVRFIRATMAILEREEITDRPLAKQRIPSARTMDRYLKNIDGNRAYLEKLPGGRHGSRGAAA